MSNQREKGPRVLEYADSTAERLPTPRTEFVRKIVVGMAVAWPLIGILAGAGSDHVQIPRPKKIALSVSASIISILMFGTARHRPSLLAVGFLLLAIHLVFVMLFWN